MLSSTQHSVAHIPSRRALALPRLRLSPVCTPCRSVLVPSVAAASAALAHVPATPEPIKFPEPIPGVLPPPLAYKKNLDTGVYKSQLPALKTFILGIVAGCFIAYGGFLALTVGANVPGLVSANVGLAKLLTGVIFPVGLMMVTLSGAELYTGNTALLTLAVLEKKAGMKDLIHNWFWSYSGNLVGSLLMVAAIAGSGMLATNPLPLSMAVAKTSIPMGQVLLRSMLCNWLVCIAVWQANSATSLPGKVMGLWPPIAAFVTIGLEHSVANMFFIPMGIALGAQVTFGQFLTNNLLPVTLGNTLAGVLCIAVPYAIAYGSMGGKKAEN